MSQYIDHTYASCLQFVSNFKITCDSLITPLESLGTIQDYTDDAFTESLTCENILASECIGFAGPTCNCEDEGCEAEDWANDAWKSNYCVSYDAEL